MKFINVTILLILISVCNSYSQKIDFRQFDSVTDLVSSSKSANKFAFVYLHYQGCGYCRKMEKKVFPNQQVIDYYNENYISISLDIDKDVLGAYFKDKYGLMGYPAQLYLDLNGELIHKSSKYNSIEELIKNGQIAMDSTRNMYFFQNKINQGDISANNLLQFFNCYGEYNKKDSLIAVYLSTSDKDNKYGYESWQLISSNTRSYNSKYFQFIIENENNYRENVDKTVIDEFLIDHWVFMINRWQFKDTPNESKRKKMKEKLISTSHPLTERVITQADYELSIKQYRLKPTKSNRWNEFMQASKQYITNDYNDWNNYNEAAWAIFKNYKTFENREESLQLGIKLSKLSIKYHKNFNNLDTCARLLKEAGHEEKAIEVIEEALIVADKNSNKYGINTAQKLLKDWKNVN